MLAKGRPAASSPMKQLYDEIGGSYRSHRAPDPRIAAAIGAALGEASPVVNVGAGAGSYEPRIGPWSGWSRPGP